MALRSILSLRDSIAHFLPARCSLSYIQSYPLESISIHHHKKN
jgi:hypothetical protein